MKECVYEKPSKRVGGTKTSMGIAVQFKYLCVQFVCNVKRGFPEGDIFRFSNHTPFMLRQKSDCDNVKRSILPVPRHIP